MRKIACQSAWKIDILLRPIVTPLVSSISASIAEPRLDAEEEAIRYGTGAKPKFAERVPRKKRFHEMTPEEYAKYIVRNPESDSNEALPPYVDPFNKTF